ncbi:MAG: universal stress protein [Thermodesulfobacteriota bacterium]|nr:universal stress protein [Thermodesulfobacteriota bacterium]
MENKDSGQKRVLVPVDGSDRALNTIRFIARFEPFTNMQVVLFHVFHKIPESYWDLANEPMMVHGGVHIAAWEGHKKRTIDNFMEKSVAMLRASSFQQKNIITKITNRKKGVARDIINEAGKGYSAVVTRRRGFTTVQGLLMGNVADKLMMSLESTPVFFAGNELPTGKILIAMDNSLDVMKAVDFTADFAKGYDYSITLLHVIRQEDGFSHDDSDDQHSAPGQEIMAPVFDKACKKLEQAGFKPENIHHKIISGAGSRAGTIAEFAKKGDHNIIVLGRHGVSRVKEFFLGRVSKKVICAAATKTVCIV